MNNCLIHYFSGTGGTNDAVKKIGNILMKNNYTVEYCNIEKDNIEKDNIENQENFDLHIFSYPIYGFGTPNIVLRYIEKLNKVKDVKGAIVCCCGGNEGQSLNHVTRILKNKGFDLLLADKVVYPSNWTQVMNPPDEIQRKKIIDDSYPHIEEITHKIINNKTSMNLQNKIVNFFYDIIFLLYAMIGRRLLGKIYIADSDCNSCGKCEKECPSKAIKIKSKKPFWNLHCEGCQRCINACPQKAIQTSVVYLSINIIGSILLIPFLYNWLKIVYAPIKIFLETCISSSFLLNFLNDIVYIIIFFTMYISFSLLMIIFLDKIFYLSSFISPIRKIFEI